MWPHQNAILATTSSSSSRVQSFVDRNQNLAFDNFHGVSGDSNSGDRVRAPSGHVIFPSVTSTGDNPGTDKSIDLAVGIELDEALLEADVGLLPAARTVAREVLNLPFEGASEQANVARVLARSGLKLRTSVHCRPCSRSG